MTSLIRQTARISLLTSFFVTQILDCSAEMSMEERVAGALASDKVGTVELRLGKIPEGYPGRDKVIAHLAELKKREAAAAKQQAITEIENRKKAASAKAAEMVLARRQFALRLREKYLDEGLDIKVSPSGKDSTQLNLKFPLFNEVWVHKFKKGPIADEVFKMGFKKVDFDDGYDYHVVLSFQ